MAGNLSNYHQRKNTPLLAFENLRLKLCNYLHKFVLLSQYLLQLSRDNHVDSTVDGAST